MEFFFNLFYKGYEDQFTLVNYGNTLGFPYDYNSVLHYTEHAFSVNGERTIVPKKAGVIIPNHDGNSRLSSIDVAEIKALYKCK